MRKTMPVGAVILGAALTVPSRDSIASTLQITSWYLAGGHATLSVWDGSQHVSGTFLVGSFKANLDGTPIGTPIYCLDIFHSFSFGRQWEVQPYIVPPDPPNPPPYNTGEAAWVANRYGWNIPATEGYKAGGVQLALWEISHDQNWRNGFSTSYQWWDNGNFKTTVTTQTSAAITYADQILDDVFDHYNPLNAGRLVYYEPLPRPNGTIYGQGQISAIPEPGTFLLLLLGLAGVIRRRIR